MIPVPAPNHPDNELVNKFSIVMMPLELRTQNVLERCRSIEKASRAMSQSPDSFMNLFLMDLVAVFPHKMSKWFILNSQCTSVISNLPGPKKAFSIWGYPVKDTMFWLPNVGHHSGEWSITNIVYGASNAFLSHFIKRLMFALQEFQPLTCPTKIGYV
jgi:hypothetical protein